MHAVLVNWTNILLSWPKSEDIKPTNREWFTMKICLVRANMKMTNFTHTSNVPRSWPSILLFLLTKLGSSFLGKTLGAYVSGGTSKSYYKIKNVNANINLQVESLAGKICYHSRWPLIAIPPRPICRFIVALISSQIITISLQVSISIVCFFTSFRSILNYLPILKLHIPENQNK